MTEKRDDEEFFGGFFWFAFFFVIGWALLENSPQETNAQKQ